MGIKHILVIENFKAAHKNLLETEHHISWITEVDRITNMKGYFRKIGIEKDASEEEWIKWALILNEIKKIDVVVNFHENRQREAFLIAQALGIEYLNPLEAIENTINKQKMRECLQKNGLDNTQNSLVENEEGIFDFFKNIDKPIVIKPLDGRASKGVTIVNSEDDIRTAIAWYKLNKMNKGYYLEEFLDGCEFSVESFTSNGQHSVIAITHKFKDEVHCVELGHCIPAKINEREAEIIEEYVVNVLESLGVRNGVTHTEIILTKQGPRIVETHLRIGGDSIRELVKKVYDIDLLEMWIKNILNENYSMKSLDVSNKYAAIYFKHNKETGHVKSIDQKNRLANNNVEELVYLKNIGDYIEPTTNSFDRLAYAIAVAENFDIAVQSAQKAVENLEFEVEETCIL
ncbi:ATP-grasp domain-containing protein [Bacillus thuringiensis]|nr:ATP-grasp domain-containing protein [Bacillus thuringiensis]